MELDLDDTSQPHASSVVSAQLADEALLRGEERKDHTAGRLHTDQEQEHAYAYVHGQEKEDDDVVVLDSRPIAEVVSNQIKISFVGARKRHTRTPSPPPPQRRPTHAATDTTVGAREEEHEQDDEEEEEEEGHTPKRRRTAARETERRIDSHRRNCRRRRKQEQEDEDDEDDGEQEEGEDDEEEEEEGESDEGDGGEEEVEDELQEGGEDDDESASSSAAQTDANGVCLRPTHESARRVEELGFQFTPQNPDQIRVIMKLFYSRLDRAEPRDQFAPIEKLLLARLAVYELVDRDKRAEFFSKPRSRRSWQTSPQLRSLKTVYTCACCAKGPGPGQKQSAIQSLVGKHGTAEEKALWKKLGGRSPAVKGKRPSAAHKTKGSTATATPTTAASNDAAVPTSGSKATSGTDASPLKSQYLGDCSRQLSRMMLQESAHYFNHPVSELDFVDVPDVSFEHYLEEIRRLDSVPMDFGTIKKRLLQHDYPTAAEVKRDVKIVFRNALGFNVPGSMVHDVAKELKLRFLPKFRTIARAEAEASGTTSNSPPAAAAVDSAAATATPAASVPDTAPSVAAATESPRLSCEAAPPAPSVPLIAAAAAPTPSSPASPPRISRAANMASPSGGSRASTPTQLQQPPPPVPTLEAAKPTTSISAALAAASCVPAKVASPTLSPAPSLAPPAAAPSASSALPFFPFFPVPIPPSIFSLAPTAAPAPSLAPTTTPATTPTAVSSSSSAGKSSIPLDRACEAAREAAREARLLSERLEGTFQDLLRQAAEEQESLKRQLKKARDELKALKQESDHKGVFLEKTIANFQVMEAQQEQLRSERDQLRQELAHAQHAQAERDQLRDERDELKEKVDRLENYFRSATALFAPPTVGAKRALSPSSGRSSAAPGGPLDSSEPPHKRHKSDP